MAKLRLDKIIASTGAASRREIKTLVKNGRVAVDGLPARKPEDKYDPENTVITIDGIPIKYKTRRVIMLNKPAGYVTATEDKLEKTVLDLITDEYRRLGVYPVGRLDKDTEGLLLLTNDGDFCHSVISPSKHVGKIYYVETDKALTPDDAIAIETGIELANNEKCMPGQLKITGENKGYIMIFEGKYHQVKRMIASCGKTVMYLKRVAVGGLRLKSDLQCGKFIELAEEDIESVFDTSKMNSIFISL